MDKSFSLIFIFICFFVNFSMAEDSKEEDSAGMQIKGSIYNQLSAYNIYENSVLNPNNLYSYGNLGYYMTGDLVFKNKFSENSKGAIKLEAQYNPVSPYTTNSVEYIFIKEMYIDMLFDFMVVRAGKQFIKWDEGVFFYPIDVVNMQRDPLKPLNQAEGNPFISILFPVQSFMSIGIISIFKPGETTNVTSLPVIPKISFDWENLSGFAFAVLEKSKKPSYGLNLDYVNSLSENNRLQFYTEFLYQYDFIKYRMVKNSSGFSLDTSTNDNFKAMAGGNISQSLPDLKYIDGVSLSIEYIYQQDAWSRDDFVNFRDYMITIRGNILQHYNSLQLCQAYQNSQHYIFSSISLQNFIIPNINLNNSAVINLTDLSGIYIPDISYYIDSMNMSFDLNGNIFFGGEKTEFGNAVFNTIINLSTQINF